MSAQLKPSKGKYCFFPGCLALVTSTNEFGFEFDCVNGAWSGAFSYATQILTIDGHPTSYATQVLSVEQPPTDMHDYNDIIPWYERRLAAMES